MKKYQYNGNDIQKTALDTLLTYCTSISKFTWLWIGETVSLFGNQITSLTIPLICITVLQASEFDMGLLSAVRSVPIVLFGLIAGAWTAKYNLWWIMFICNLGRALLVSMIPILYKIGKLNFLFILLTVLLTSVFSVFFNIAYQTFVPEIVEDKKLLSANSKLELSQSLSRLVGPALSGFMIACFSMQVVIILDAISFFIAAMALLPIYYQRSLLNMASDNNDSLLEATETSIKKTIISGISFIFKNRLLRLIIISASLSNFFVSGVLSLEILFANSKLGLSAQTIGLCISIAGITALLSSLLVTIVSNKMGECRTIAMGWILLLLGLICVAFAREISGIWMFSTAQALFGVSGPLINASLVTLRQKITPRPILGMVNASARVFIMCSLPLGALFAGSLSTIFEIQTSLIFLCAGAAIVVLLTTPRLFLTGPLEEKIVKILLLVIRKEN